MCLLVEVVFWDKSLDVIFFLWNFGADTLPYCVVNGVHCGECLLGYFSLEISSFISESVLDMFSVCFPSLTLFLDEIPMLGSSSRFFSLLFLYFPRACLNLIF